jgi:hypothetical protein
VVVRELVARDLVGISSGAGDGSLHAHPCISFFVLLFARQFLQHQTCGVMQAVCNVGDFVE